MWRYQSYKFADDTLIFGKPSLRNILFLKSMLRCFELAFGLKVNVHNFKIVSIEVDDGEIQRFPTLLNCKSMSVLFVYLGISVGENLKMESTWEPILQKVWNKRSLWTHRLLSYKRRICLINFVLYAIPLFYLSFYLMPPKGC